MESLDTMLSDAVSISTLLPILDTKYHKFRQLKKQMSNISTPSPAASPSPLPDPGTAPDLINIAETDAISQTVLKTINSLEAAGAEAEDKLQDSSSSSLKDAETMERMEAMAGEDLETPVTIGAEFFPPRSPASPLVTAAVSSVTLSVHTSSHLTCLTASGKQQQQREMLSEYQNGNNLRRKPEYDVRVIWPTNNFRSS